jgi:hypothetical protein
MAVGNSAHGTPGAVPRSRRHIHLAWTQSQLPRCGVRQAHHPRPRWALCTKHGTVAVAQVASASVGGPWSIGGRAGPACPPRPDSSWGRARHAASKWIKRTGQSTPPPNCLLWSIPWPVHPACPQRPRLITYTLWGSCCGLPHIPPPCPIQALELLLSTSGRTSASWQRHKRSGTSPQLPLLRTLGLQHVIGACTQLVNDHITRPYVHITRVSQAGRASMTSRTARKSASAGSPPSTPIGPRLKTRLPARPSSTGSRRGCAPAGPYRRAFQQP